MALQRGQRVWETSTTTGTGALTLAGAVANYRAFSAICANNDTVPYSIVNQSAPSEWESGTGTWGTGNILTRTTVVESSNAGAAVNFSAGTKDVFCEAAAGTISDIYTQIAGKAATSHTHPESDVTNLTTDLAGKAASSHTHAQSDVTGGWQLVKKTSDESRTATAISLDSAIQLSLSANITYHVRVRLIFTVATSIAIKFRTVGPASPTFLVRSSIWAGGGAAQTLVGMTGTYHTADSTLAGAPTAGLISEDFFVQNGGTAGSLGISWASNTGAAVVVRAGSYLEWTSF